MLLAGALGVHELRYRVAYSDRAHEVLSSQGHGYMAAVAPIVGLLIAVGLARLVLRAAAASPRSLSAVRVRRVWPMCSAALFGIYGIQELVEGALMSGHPVGWAGVMSGGGWVALPLAIVIGAVIATALRFARAAERGVAAHLAVRWTPLAPPCIAPGPAVVAPIVRRLTARLSGRAPPKLSV